MALLRLMYENLIAPMLSIDVCYAIKKLADALSHFYDKEEGRGQCHCHITLQPEKEAKDEDQKTKKDKTRDKAGDKQRKSKPTRKKAREAS